jgi:hypothetical protein
MSTSGETNVPPRPCDKEVRPNRWGDDDEEELRKLVAEILDTGVPENKKFQQILNLLSAEGVTAIKEYCDSNMRSYAHNDNDNDNDKKIPFADNTFFSVSHDSNSRVTFAFDNVKLRGGTLLSLSEKCKILLHKAAKAPKGPQKPLNDAPKPSQGAKRAPKPQFPSNEAPKPRQGGQGGRKPKPQPKSGPQGPPAEQKAQELGERNNPFKGANFYENIAKTEEKMGKFPEGSDEMDVALFTFYVLCWWIFHSFHKGEYAANVLPANAAAKKGMRSKDGQAERKQSNNCERCWKKSQCDKANNKFVYHCNYCCYDCPDTFATWDDAKLAYNLHKLQCRHCNQGPDHASNLIAECLSYFVKFGSLPTEGLLTYTKQFASAFLEVWGKHSPQLCATQKANKCAAGKWITGHMEAFNFETETVVVDGIEMGFTRLLETLNDSVPKISDPLPRTDPLSETPESPAPKKPQTQKVKPPQVLNSNDFPPPETKNPFSFVRSKNCEKLFIKKSPQDGAAPAAASPP